MKARPRQSERERVRGVMRAQEIIDLLGTTFIKASDLYVDLDPDGRQLTRNEMTKVREQMTAITLCLREIHSDHELIDYLAADGRRTGRDTDLRPTISLLRKAQRSFGLALSDDPQRRAETMPGKEFFRSFEPISRFWIDL